MAEGGIYDHLGGGFARYSVDAKWLVPHFEKMLYDQAQLLGIYASVVAMGGPFAARAEDVIAETVAFLERELSDPRGRPVVVARRRQRGRGGQVLRVDARRSCARRSGR